MTILKPYPAPKDSGINWLAHIPEHWKLVRLRSVATLSASNVDKISSTDEIPVRLCNYTDVYYNHLITDDLKFMAGTATPDEIERFSLRGGEVLFTKDSESFDDIGIPAVADEGLENVVVGYHLMMARPGKRLSGHYLAWFFTPQVNRWQFEVSAKGVTRFGMPQSGFKDALIPLPPLHEQRAIADFLDGMDARITRFIAARRKMIALLEEEKQAVINQAVTRGLDPDAPMKDSGVDWLGKIPAHWNVMSLQRITQSKCDGPFGSGLKSSHYTEEGVRVVRLQNIGFAKFRDSDAAFIPTDYYATLGDHDVHGGDILIAGLGDSAHPCGRACVAPPNIEPAMVKADCFRFRVSPKATNVHFLALQLSATADGVSAALSTGATRQRVNLQRMSGRSIALPSIGEQQSIVDHIDRETARIDTLISRHHHEIELMQEYRTRIISDVVTGKLDVRGVELPAVEEIIGEKIEAAMMDEAVLVEEI